jgi:hypothetical protein
LYILRASDGVCEHLASGAECDIGVPEVSGDGLLTGRVPIKCVACGQQFIERDGGGYEPLPPTGRPMSASCTWTVDECHRENGAPCADHHVGLRLATLAHDRDMARAELAKAVGLLRHVQATLLDQPFWDRLAAFLANHQETP